MKSCDTHNMQWESAFNEKLRTYIVTPGSVRLICPVCGHIHEEWEKAWMIQNGGYVHLVPELLKTHPRLSSRSISLSA